jgi:phenylpyruvate tautomerase PptA (4-oxalocrotonate tautomerase family)
LRFRVIVPEGVVPEAVRPELCAGLARIHAALFSVPAAEIGVDFTELPRGRFFTAGQASRTSIIAGTVPAGTPDERRHRLLGEITALWCETTGCTPHEVVVTAADARPA